MIEDWKLTNDESAIGNRKSVRASAMIRAMVTVAIVLIGVGVSASRALTRSSQQSPQRPVFQAGTDTVVLDVAVRRNGEPVLGLTASDFLISDNGVSQTIDHMTAEAFPLDLTLLIDESGYGQTVLDRIKNAASTAADLLGDDDHLRVVTFNALIRQLYDGTPVDAASSLTSIESAGRTSLYDALVASLTRRRSPDRRSLVLVFTVGVDSSSTTSPAILKEVAKRADVILDVFLTYDPDVPDSGPMAGRFTPSPSAPAAGGAAGTASQQPPAAGVGQFDPHVKDAAEATGGVLEEMPGDEGIATRLKTALLDFKARYMLSYTISGVAKPGWHDLTVKIKGHDDDTVLVRKGYDG